MIAAATSAEPRTTRMTDTTATEDPPIGAGGSILFSRYGALGMLAIAGASAWQGYTLPVFLCGIILALTAVTRGWSHAALHRLTYSRHPRALRAFPGETIDCEAMLDNRKILPLVWVSVAEPLAEGIAPDAEALPPGMTYAEGKLTVETSLMWYQRARWTYALNCRRRGYYALGPVEVTSSDIFGIFRPSRQAAELEHLAVYPQVHALGDLGLPSHFPLGDLRSSNPLFHDPTRVRGLRDYTPEVPFRHIHWKASARAGHLQAKVFDPTCTLQLSLLLDATAVAKTAVKKPAPPPEFPIAGPPEDTPNDDLGDNDFELALSVAASLAWHHGQRRCPVGLFANTKLADGAHSAVVKPSAGHLAEILTALAKAEPKTVPFSTLLETVRPSLASGSTLAVITGGLDRASEARLAELRRRGFPVVLFLIGAEAPGSNLFPTHRIVRPADLAGAA